MKILLWSGDEIPHIGRYGGHKWHVWLLEVGCTSRAHTQWYVQNVSTFPNLFAIVFPLICVFWMQLTRTNAVFSRIALVSRFVQKSNFQEKSQKIPQNPYFTRRLTEPEDRTEKCHEGPTPSPGAGQARPRLGQVRPPPVASRLPLRTIRSPVT